MSCISLLALPEVFLRTRSDEIPFSPVIGDIDSDGNPEIIISSQTTSESDGWITVIRKGGRFTPPISPDNIDTLWSNRYGRACFTPAIADVNGDGAAEIYCDIYHDAGGMGVLCVDAISGSVIWQRDFGGTYYENAGHEVLLADYDSDGDIEVIAQHNPSGGPYRVYVLTATTGATEFFIDCPKRTYASMDCEDVNDDGRNELIASCSNGSVGDVEVYVWDEFGDVIWHDDGGPPAIADVDLDGEAEIVCGWVESGTYDFNLYIYSDDGVLENEYMLLSSVSTSYRHYECPVIADFDPLTPEPEIAFAVNHTPTSSECVITVIHTDGSIYWQTPHFDEGEIISMSAADLSCDGIPELCSYNMAGEFIVFDGATGDFWVTFGDFVGDYLPDPNRFVAIADMDYDCHAEFALSTYRGGYSGTDRGVYIYGNDDEWNPVRRLWNTGSYYYTNVDDRLRLLTPETSYQHWFIDNTWRAQRVIPCGLEIIPGPELVEDQIECASCDSIGEFNFSARIWNPTCEEIAYYTQCILEFDHVGDSCLNYISGQCTTYIGDLLPETDTVIHWQFEVSPECDSADISFWVHATCLNSLIVDNRHYYIPCGLQGAISRRLL